MEAELIKRLEIWAKKAEEWDEFELSSDLRCAVEALRKRQTEASTGKVKKDIPIEDLNLSVRAYHCLHYAGILTVADILRLDANRFLRIQNMNPVCAREIIRALTSAGYDCTYLNDEKK